MFSDRSAGLALILAAVSCDDAAIHRETGVLAVVDDRRVTMAELARRVEELPPNLRPKNHDALAGLFAQLVDEAILDAEARRRGFSDSAGGRAAQSAMLSALRLEALAASVSGEVSDDEVRRYHAEHRERYTTPEVRRIAVASFASREEALDARQGGVVGAEDVGEIAPGAVDSRGDGVPAPVRDAAFGLAAVGAISDPVPHAGRHWLVKLTGRVAGEERGVAREETNIRRAIVEERLRRARDALLVNLRASTRVTVDEAALADVESRGDLTAYDPAEWQLRRGPRR
ncbi:MAG: peptidyl-prolyl cis-trans isomerase [Deltaproteobacteria bacterium]|nr:peptidyl-prolyl cis-trans isomerase [Deltaproteobacteria bacterium]